MCAADQKKAVLKQTRPWHPFLFDLLLIRGVPCLDKSFPTIEEAMLFAAGKNPNPGSKPDRFYAVAVGKKPGIYTEWPEAQAAYTGVKAPKYKKFDSKQAAEEWLRTFEGQSSFALDDEGEEEDEDDEDDEDAESEPVAKRHQSEAQFTLATDLDEFVPPVQQIWTDGSSLSNGKKGAVAGVGVFFGDGDPRSVICSLCLLD